jgi:outer membrane receptor for ferrienterochelin and colicins
MRLALVALLAASACVPAGGRPGLDADDAVPRPRAPDIDGARDLDQEGVRAFREGRWMDAMRYFRASYRLGGPSSEVWNIARCHERLDDPEGAVTTLEQYLALRDLSPPDRAEAEREAQALRARASTLTVTTSPAGALVTIDGKPAAGPTPISVEVPPGSHSLSIHRDGYATETRPFEARFGRAVIVTLELARAGDAKR